ncbi:hydrogenase iron-sulfur subunit [Candidatus Latescibacterota bacterium]
MHNTHLKMYIYCCSTSVDTDELTRRFNGNDDSEIKVLSLPCSGKLNVLYLIKTFETGADGVIVVTCKEGKCRYLEGNLRAKKRAEAVDILLDEIGLGTGRITVIQTEEGNTEQLIQEIIEFRNGIKIISNQ